jgi:tRNA A-37 threonylcarbamoyl transferase component Bud32
MTKFPDNIPSFEDARMDLIQKKTKGNITREVYRYDQILIKRFLKTRLFPDMRPVWKWEDRALQRLAGLAVPVTYGFRKQRLKRVSEIIYAREYVQGRPLRAFTLKDMVPLGKIMAQIHQRGVITRDPAPDNYIKTPNGDILCIDFGRAALLSSRNPVLWHYLGKEMARLRYHALSGDRELFRRFQEAYFETLPAGPVHRWLIDRVSSLWYRRFTRKHSRPQK